MKSDLNSSAKTKSLKLMQKSFTEKSVSHQSQSKKFHRKKKCRNFGVKSGEMRKVTKKLLLG